MRSTSYRARSDSTRRGEGPYIIGDVHAPIQESHALSAATAGPLPRARVEAVQRGSLFADRLESHFYDLACARAACDPHARAHGGVPDVFGAWRAHPRIPAREHVAREGGEG